jgi:hypothetical protein
MRKETVLLLQLIFFAILISGCKSEKKEILPAIPGIDTSSSRVNQDIDLILRPSRNTFKIGEEVVIDVHLQSDIQMKSDFDVKMYALDEKDNSWIEVEDFAGDPDLLPLLEHEPFLLDKDNSYSIISVHPVLKEKNTEIKFLITVKGPILANSEKTSEVAESYIIFSLHP